MFDTLVDVTVGKGSTAKIFKVHKGVLCFYSGYFNSALNGGFKEARKGAVELETEDVDVFERFVLWLYTRKLDDDEYPRTFRPACELWAFADRRQVPMLMNACIDTIKSIFVKHWVCPTVVLNYIYENTTTNSGLRLMAIHIIGKSMAKTTVMAFRKTEDWSKDVLWDFLDMKWGIDDSKYMSRDEAADLDTCQFHQHEERITCSKKRKDQEA